MTQTTEGLPARIERVSNEYQAAREQLERATDNVKAVVAEAAEAGVSDTALGRAFKIDRHTVRKWLGKSNSSGRRPPRRNGASGV